MRSVPRTVVIALAVCAVGLAPLASGAAPAKPAAAIRFAPSVVVDPMRLGGEPSMVTDSKGNIYISSIIGFSNHTSFLWKSEDGGESFDLLRLPVPALQRPSATLGGGDTTLIVGPPAEGRTEDTLIFIDLEGLVSFGSGTSFDGGNTFTNHQPFASGYQPVADRQWGAHWRDADGVDHYYNFFNGIVGTGGATVAQYAIVETTDYGLTWHDWKRNVTTTAGRSRPGPLFIDPKTGDLMLTWTWSSEPTVEPGANPPVRPGTTGGAGFTLCTQAKVCRDTMIATLPNHDFNNTFVTGARDRHGNLYVAWSAIPRGALSPATSPTRVYMSVSRNKGATWSKPVVASGSLPAASMPSIVAGDAGRVSIAYYGTSKKGDPNFNSGPWHVYVSQSVNALSAKPSFAVARVTEHTNHVNPICTAGLECSADQDRGDDRNLIDFLYAAIGRNGETYVTWGDTAHQIGPRPPKGAPITMFAKQVAGPSLYATPGRITPPPADRLEYSGRPNVVRSKTQQMIPVNWRADPIADAAVPRHASGGPGAQNTTLDLTSAWLEPAGSQAMRASMTVRDAFDPQVPSPYTNNFYMLWWWSKNSVHYAAAEVGPTRDDPISDCYAGEPSFSHPASPRWALYVAAAVPPPAVTRIECTLNPDTGRLDMLIPLEAVGASIGDTLYSVTASASVIVIPNIALNAAANLPDEIDQVSPFSYVVGAARQQKTRGLARR